MQLDLISMTIEKRKEYLKRILKDSTITEAYKYSIIHRLHELELIIDTIKGGNSILKLIK
jgi:hypothetical protein